MNSKIKDMIDAAINLSNHETIINYVLESYIQLRIKEQIELDNLDKVDGNELRDDFDDSEVSAGKPIQCTECQLDHCKPYCIYLIAYQNYLKLKAEKSRELLNNIFM